MSEEREGYGSKETTSAANTYQPGGDHYRKFGAIQPWDVIALFNLGFFDGNAVKYLLRWRHKGGMLDLEKAKHYIEKLIEMQRNEQNAMKRNAP